MKSYEVNEENSTIIFKEKKMNFKFKFKKEDFSNFIKNVEKRSQFFMKNEIGLKKKDPKIEKEFSHILTKKDWINLMGGKLFYQIILSNYFLLNFYF